MLLKSPLHFDQFNKEWLFISTNICYLKFLITPTLIVAEHDSSFVYFSKLSIPHPSPFWNPFHGKLANLQFSFLNVDLLYFLFKFYFCKDPIIISKGPLDYCEKHSKTMCQQENNKLLNICYRENFRSYQKFICIGLIKYCGLLTWFA